MKFLYRNLLGIIFLGISSLTFSSSLCIIVTQHDNMVSSLRDTTYLIENGIMDILYDAGHIVSNVAPNINGENASALKIAVESGKNGYLTYAVHIIIYYQATTSNPTGVILEDIKSVDIEIVRTHDGSFVYEEKNIVPMKNNGETDVKAIERFSKQLGLNIQDVLSGNF